VTDAHALLESLRGRDLRSIQYATWNCVLRIEGYEAIVATTSEPAGRGVAVSQVQHALDLLDQGGWVSMDIETVGCRSAFIGAVLSTLDDVVIEEHPRRVRRRLEPD
jgi:hypothetical protein